MTLHKLQCHPTVIMEALECAISVCDVTDDVNTERLLRGGSKDEHTG
jgi:hypothetical protein